MKTVSCKVNEIKTNSGSCTIECDTVKTPLSTNLGNLTLAKSSNPEKFKSTASLLLNKEIENVKLITF